MRHNILTQNGVKSYLIENSLVHLHFHKIYLQLFTLIFLYLFYTWILVILIWSSANFREIADGQECNFKNELTTLCVYALYALVTQATTYGMFLQPGGDAYKFNFRLRVFIKAVELSSPINEQFLVFWSKT